LPRSGPRPRQVQNGQRPGPILEDSQRPHDRGFHPYAATPSDDDKTTIGPGRIALIGRSYARHRKWNRHTSPKVDCSIPL
jgi:hypothetical protein